MTPALSKATAAVKYDVAAAGMLNPQPQKWILRKPAANKL
jgi:hypothetical protein